MIASFAFFHHVILYSDTAITAIPLSCILKCIEMTHVT